MSTPNSNTSPADTEFLTQLRQRADVAIGPAERGIYAALHVALTARDKLRLHGGPDDADRLSRLDRLAAAVVAAAAGGDVQARTLAKSFRLTLARSRASGP